MIDNESICPICGAQIEMDGDERRCPACGWSSAGAASADVDTSDDSPRQFVQSTSEADEQTALAAKVEALIQSLPDCRIVTTDNEQEIERVRRSYEELSDETRAHILNINKLLLAEEAIQLIYRKKADKVNYAVMILPDVEMATLDCESQVEECEKLYAQLPEQSLKYLIGYDKVPLLRKRLEELKDPDFFKKQKKAARLARREERRKQREARLEQLRDPEYRAKRRKQRRKVVGWSVIVFAVVALSTATTLIWTRVIDPALLYDFYIDLLYKPTSDLEYVFDDNIKGYVVTGVSNSNQHNILVPDKYNGGHVKRIGENAFSGHSEIRKVVISDSVTAIEGRAFADCKNLRLLRVSDMLITIAEDALDGSKGIIYNIYNGVEYLGDEENRYLVAVRPEKTNVKSVTISSQCRVVAPYCFAGCAELQEVVFENGEDPMLTSVCDGAFYDCAGLKKVVFTSSFFNLGDGAFDYCDSLSEIIVPIEEVNARRTWIAIEGGLASEGKLMIAQGQDIFVQAFDASDRPVVETIGNWAYFDRDDIETLTIPEGVKSITEGAFAFCDNITSVSLPKDIKSISEHSFHGCLALTDVYYNGTEKQWSQVVNDSPEIAAAAVHFAVVDEKEGEEEVEEAQE